jgi:hypothetical protein
MTLQNDITIEALRDILFRTNNAAHFLSERHSRAIVFDMLQSIQTRAEDAICDLLKDATPNEAQDDTGK